MAVTNTDQETIRANWRVFLACGLILLSPFQYGVDFGMIGGFQAMPGFLQIYGYRADTPSGWNIEPLRQQLISSLMTLGAFISAAAAGVAARWLGRRACLWVACAVCCVSNIIMMTTTDIGALYAGRFLIGLANGYFMCFSQLYIQESSPAKYRGLFLSVFQFCTSTGTLVGNVVDWATAKRPDQSAYLIPLGLIYVIPAFLTVGLFFIPESPRWLILQGKHEQARKSLLRLRPDGADIDAEAAEINSSIEREKEMGAGVGFLDMIKTPTDRRRTILSICAVTLQAASGSMFIIAYKQYFFTMAKVTDPFGMGCVLSAVGLIAIILNSLVIVRFGFRRVFIMTGMALCGILQLIVAVTFDRNPGAPVTGQVLVALSCLYMMSYNGLISTYAWLAGGEIPSQRLRSYTFGMAAAVGFFGAWLTTFTAPYFINPAAMNWGPRYGYIWFPSCVIAGLWVFFFLPETKGRTLEEIDEMFEAKIPARKFRQYVCVGRSNAAEKTTSIDAVAWENESGREKIEKGIVEAVETTAVPKP